MNHIYQFYAVAFVIPFEIHCIRDGISTNYEIDISCNFIIYFVQFK